MIPHRVLLSSAIHLSVLTLKYFPIILDKSCAPFPWMGSEPRKNKELESVFLVICPNNR